MNNREVRVQEILPAITITDVADAIPVAKAISDGGIYCMEIAFRTPEAPAALEEICNHFPAFSVGAGTLLTTGDLKKAKDLGASFGLSPGFNPKMIEAAKEMDFPFIPGVATPGEIEQAMMLGCRLLKLFPVEPMGGLSYLAALEAPYKHTGVKFIPMGGIAPGNMSGYLKSPMVTAVGGSWLTPKEVVHQKKYEQIKSDVREALSFLKRERAHSV